LRDGLGGLGEEAPEDVEVVGVDGKQLEAGGHAAFLGMVGQLAGLGQQRIAGGGLNQQRRQAGQVRGQRIDQRIVSGVPGQVEAGRRVPEFVEFMRQALAGDRGQVDPGAEQDRAVRQREVLLLKAEQDRQDQAAA